MDDSIIVLLYSSMICIFSIIISMIANMHNQSSTLLARTKSPPAFQSYSSKLDSAVQLNSKLKQLYQTMRSNALARKAQSTQTTDRDSACEPILRLRKKMGKLSSQLQQLTNNLNSLISMNNNLKAQVDVSRNSRVIYSNVYKNIEKEIRKHQYLYRLAIVDSLAYQEVQKRVEDRLAKAQKKIEKDIAELQGHKPMRKKDKRKSRLDTGLTSYRIDSKDTNRISMEESNTHRFEPSKHQPTSRRETVKAGNDKSQVPSVCAQAIRKQQSRIERTQKNIKSRTKMTMEKVDSYYQLEMQSNYYDNVLKHLQEITNLDDLTKIQEEWATVDSQLEENYAFYMQLEGELKLVREEGQQLENLMAKGSLKEIVQKTREEDELQAILGQIQKEKLNLSKLQQKLTGVIDLNCSKLTDQDITQHIQRIKRRGDCTSKQLDKLLQNISKEKSHNLATSRITNKSRVS